MRGHAVKTPQNVAEAARLREQGLTLREIGERFGVTLTAVQDWLVDPDGSKRRARKAARGGTCVECGAPTTLNGREPHPRCVACARRAPARLADRKARSERRRRRFERIAELWAAGLSMPEIAADVGFSVNSLGTEMCLMRRQGWDLPHRYRMENGRRVAA